MIKLISLLIISFSLLSIIPSVSFAQEPSEESLEGKITNVLNEEIISETGDKHTLQTISVEVYKGSLEGEIVQITNNTQLISGGREFEKGDKVVIMRTEDLEGDDIFFITDHLRRDGLLILFIAFSIIAIAIGGIWGVSSLLGMAISFLVIFKIILPMILSGNDAVLSAIIGSTIIIPITFGLSHGVKAKTGIAIMGTLITLILTGIIAAISVETTHLTGFGTEEAGFLQSQLGGLVNIKGLLLAGMIISSLGILDDITISQASIVAELKEANKKYTSSILFKKGMNVGRDHIASLINTLVLVYAGASLPLLLLFVNNPSPFSEVINIELIAEEIVKTLVGSIGLIMAVPITTALSAYYYSKS